jgi:protein-S-isoprenylcysteine O-methyltransferase Ste14
MNLNEADMETQTLKHEKDNPGVYVPPPLVYVAFFFIAVWMQNHFPLTETFVRKEVPTIAGFIFIIIALPFLITSLRQFYLTKNTLVTIRPAASLQTRGIYRITRNPMYLALACIYLAITCFIGSWWNLILFPLLITVVQVYIIKREERYLTRRFGDSYLNYKKEVRRWL